MRPDFGAGLDAFVFEPVNPTTMTRRRDAGARRARRLGAAHRRARRHGRHRPDERDRLHRGRLPRARDQRAAEPRLPVLPRGGVAAVTAPARPRRRSARRATRSLDALLAAARRATCPSGSRASAAPTSRSRRSLARYLAARSSRASTRRRTSTSWRCSTCSASQLIPAQAARAPVVFTLADNAADARVPAGTRLAAKAPDPPPVSAAPTADRRAGDAAGPDPRSRPSGRPGSRRRSWSSCAACGRAATSPSTTCRARAAGATVPALAPADLEDMPHHIYIAHSTLLALAGQLRTSRSTSSSRQGASEPPRLHLGVLGREGLAAVQEHVAACDRRRRRAGGQHRAVPADRHRAPATDCAETKPTTVDGIENFWVRGRLDRAAAPGPGAAAARGRTGARCRRS